MREIKFRAWEDGILREWHKIRLMRYIQFESLKNVEQYAGLKDSNGVEIYEGDIVEQDNELLIVVRGEYFTRGYNDAEDRHFGFYLKYPWEDAVNNVLTFEDYFIVKGNIHQNKELLED